MLYLIVCDFPVDKCPRGEFGSLADKKENKTVLFQTIQGIYAYEIVSVMKVDVSMFPFQQVEFDGDSSLEAYIKQAEVPVD